MPSTALVIFIAALSSCAVHCKPTVSRENDGNGNFGFKYEVSHYPGNSRMHMNTGVASKKAQQPYQPHQETRKPDLGGYKSNSPAPSEYRPNHYENGPKSHDGGSPYREEVIHEPQPVYLSPYDSVSKPLQSDKVYQGNDKLYSENDHPSSSHGSYIPNENGDDFKYPNGASSPPQEYTNPPVSQEHINPHFSQDNIQPISQDYIKSTISGEVNPHLSQKYNNPPVSQEYIQSPVLQEHIDVPVSQEHVSPPNVKGSPVSQEYIQSPVLQEHIDVPVSQEHVSPPNVKGSPVSQEYIQSPVLQEHIDVPVSQEHVSPPNVKGSPVSQEYINPPVSQEYINPPVPQDYIKTPVSKEYINTPLSQEYTNPPVSQEYINPPVSQEYINPPVSQEYINPQVSQEYIKPPVSKGYASSPIPQEHNPQVSQEYVELPVSQEHIVPHIQQGPIDEPVLQQSIKSPIAQENIHIPISQENINPKISQEQVNDHHVPQQPISHSIKTAYPTQSNPEPLEQVSVPVYDAPIEASHAVNAGPKYQFIPSGPPYVTNSHSTEIIHPPLPGAPNKEIVEVSDQSLNSYPLNEEEKPASISHAFRLPIPAVSHGPSGPQVDQISPENHNVHTDINPSIEPTSHSTRLLIPNYGAPSEDSAEDVADILPKSQLDLESPRSFQNLAGESRPSVSHSTRLHLPGSATSHNSDVADLLPKSQLDLQSPGRFQDVDGGLPPFAPFPQGSDHSTENNAPILPPMSHAFRLNLPGINPHLQLSPTSEESSFDTNAPSVASVDNAGPSSPEVSHTPRISHAFRLNL